MFNKFFASRPRLTSQQIRSARAARKAMLQTPVRPYEHRDTDCL